MSILFDFEPTSSTDPFSSPKLTITFETRLEDQLKLSSFLLNQKDKLNRPPLKLESAKPKSTISPEFSKVTEVPNMASADQDASPRRVPFSSPMPSPTLFATASSNHHQFNNLSLSKTSGTILIWKLTPKVGSPK